VNPDDHGCRWEYDAGMTDARRDARRELAETLTALRNARGMLTDDESRQYNAALDAVAKAANLKTETTVRYSA
jgi:hypothetical protein